MVDKQTFLKVDQLKIHRMGKLVVDIPTLNVEQGDVLAVAGPNGAGKSTFLLALAGLIKPTSGNIYIGQNANNSSNHADHKKCALVLQEPLLLHTSIRENIGIGLSFRGADKDTIHQKVDQWLEVFGISHLSNRQAYQLSGGEAQRVSLARAFATGADLLLLDEPFSSLDAPTRLGLLNDFQSILKSSRQTAIFITHDLDEALMLGSQIAILIGGQLRQVGSPRQVFDEPADSEVADFVGVETIISGEICTQKDGLVEVQTDVHLLEAVSDYQVGKMVYLCLRPEDITITLTPGQEQTSARNHLHCKILAIQPKGPLFRVLLDSGDAKLVSLVTRTSALEMKLVSGMNVIANFKSSAIHLLPR